MSLRIPVIRDQDVEMINKRPLGSVEEPLWMSCVAQYPPVPKPLVHRKVIQVEASSESLLAKLFVKKHPEFSGLPESAVPVEQFAKRQAVIMNDLAKRNPERFSGLSESQRFSRLYRESYTLAVAEGDWNRIFKAAWKDFRFSKSADLFNEYVRVTQKDMTTKRNPPQSFRVIRNEITRAAKSRKDDALWRDTALRLRAIKAEADKRSAATAAAAAKPPLSSEAPSSSSDSSSPSSSSAKPSSDAGSTTSTP